MTQRFLVDAQLPPGLADHLVQAGLQADHVQRIDLGDATDRSIWAFAQTAGLTLVTKDGDFADLARRFETGPQVLWIKIGNTTNAILWQAISRVLPEIVEALECGERVVAVE